MDNIPLRFYRFNGLMVTTVLMIALQKFPYKVEKTSNPAVSFADMDTREYNSYILKIEAISFQ
jgi:hypothetical protein